MGQVVVLRARKVNSENLASHRLLACEDLDAEIEFLHNLLLVRIYHATLCPGLAHGPNWDDRRQTLFALQASRKASYGPGRLERSAVGTTRNKQKSDLTQFLDLKGLSGVA